MGLSQRDIGTVEAELPDRALKTNARRIKANTDAKLRKLRKDA